MRFTFNWTDLRVSGLVGFEGADLAIDGVTHEGNLVHVDSTVVPVQLNPADGHSRVRTIYGTPVYVRDAETDTYEPEVRESDAIEVTEAAIDGEPWAVELYEKSERKFATPADVSRALWAATRE